MDVCSLILFMMYFTPPRTAEEPTYKQAVNVALLSTMHFLVMLAGTVYVAVRSDPVAPTDPDVLPTPSKALVQWANFLGVQSMILASVQYIPQLWTTWRLKHVGSLSIPMMMIQTPGSFVFVASLAGREGTRWSSWVTYAVTGTLQGVLLVMCVCWEVRDRQKKVEGEREALLARED